MPKTIFMILSSYIHISGEKPLKKCMENKGNQCVIQFTGAKKVKIRGWQAACRDKQSMQFPAR